MSIGVLLASSGNRQAVTNLESRILAAAGAAAVLLPAPTPMAAVAVLLVEAAAAAQVKSRAVTTEVTSSFEIVCVKESCIVAYGCDCSSHA